MKRVLRISGSAVLLVLVAGCASVAPRPSGDWLDERRDWFANYPDWSVEGRLGLSDGQRGGSLAMHWQARGAIHEIHLRTLAGGQQWRLVLEPDWAVLSGSEVGRIEGHDPDALVQQAIGWPIPVRHLADWLRGLPAPGSARIEHSADGLMQRLEWDGWTLDYQRWASWGDGSVHLPARIDALRASQQLRLALRGWRFEAADHAASER